MKVSSKDLYAILREELAAELKAMGFKRLKMGMLGWTRPSGTGHLSFWFQCDKYGWDPAFGSKFTVEFQIGKETVAGVAPFANTCRFADLLDDCDLERVRSINNSILKSLPEPLPDHPMFLLPNEVQQLMKKQYEVRNEPYRRIHDPWLHYYTRDNVETWASFFKERIADMLNEFEHRNGKLVL